MAQGPESEERSEGLHPFRRLFFSTIRGKIILPYLVLTLIVAVIGTYVVTGLVVSSLDERLTNQLLEAGRVVSDSLANQELEHLEVARAIAFTEQLAEAVQAGDQGNVKALAQPVAVVQGIEGLIIVDAQGREMLHMLQQDDGTLISVEGQFDASRLWLVRTLLEVGDPDSLPKRGLVLHSADDRYYYFTAIPIGLDGQVAGVVVVGTSLDTLLPEFKLTSLADVVIYLDGGRAIASSFALAEKPDNVPALLDALSIAPEKYESALSGTGYSVVENDVRVRDRMYRIARGPLQVGNETLGVFAVALPSHFIAQARAVNRNIYTAIFTVAMAAVVLVGYLISRRITSPLTRLVRATKAVAEGHLDQRTGIESSDEIGTLAETFDDMTGKLSDRTRALEEAIGRMRAILSSIGDGVVLEDLEGKLNPLNAAAETLLDEMSANFMLGPLQELSAGEYDQATEIQPSPWLLERRRFQVGKKVVSAHSASVRTDDDERLGTVIVLRDVTAEVEAERLKDAFITHVSHELRTPLTAVKGYVDLLLVGAAGALDEEQMGFLDTISRHTDNLVAMINELLDFSEMEAGGRLGLRPRPVLLSTLVEEIADELRPQVDEKGLTLTVELPDELPLVDADTRRLRWAVINLVRNAWQYTPAGGVVTLRLLQRDGQVKLDVVDTGIGISPEDQKNLFTRFYRVTNVTKDDVRGLGLGLYVAKAIVEAHGGQIEVVSEEGVGSTFSVILPALKDRQVEKSTN